MLYKLVMHHHTEPEDHVDGWDVDYLDEGEYKSFDSAYQRALEYIHGERKFQGIDLDMMQIEHGQEEFGFYKTPTGWEDDAGKLYSH